MSRKISFFLFLSFFTVLNQIYCNIFHLPFTIPRAAIASSLRHNNTFSWLIYKVVKIRAVFFFNIIYIYVLFFGTYSRTFLFSKIAIILRLCIAIYYVINYFYFIWRSKMRAFMSTFNNHYPYSSWDCVFFFFDNIYL